MKQNLKINTSVSNCVIFLRNIYYQLVSVIRGTILNEMNDYLSLSKWENVIFSSFDDTIMFFSLLRNDTYLLYNSYFKTNRDYPSKILYTRCLEDDGKTLKRHWLRLSKHCLRQILLSFFFNFKVFNKKSLQHSKMDFIIKNL